MGSSIPSLRTYIAIDCVATEQSNFIFSSLKSPCANPNPGHGHHEAAGTGSHAGRAAGLPGTVAPGGEGHGKGWRQIE